MLTTTAKTLLMSQEGSAALYLNRLRNNEKTAQPQGVLADQKDIVVPIAEDQTPVVEMFPGEALFAKCL